MEKRKTAGNNSVYFIMNMVKKALENLINRTDPKAMFGRKVDKTEFDALNLKANNIIPEWFIELHTKYPFSNMILELQDSEVEDCEYVLEIAPPKWIESELFDLVPGCCIAEFGYLCIAEDPTGGGDPYFININEGINPPVYQIYHDISDNGKEILDEGKVKIANSLSELLDRCSMTI